VTPSSASLLVVDVGTSGLRAGIVRPDATVTDVHQRELLPSSPMPGFVEFDPVAMASAALDCARAALADGGPVGAVGITNQRASTIVWDRKTGEPVGPGVGWQDLRTAGTCIMLREQGVRVAPNVSATKLQFLLDMADPERSRDLCFGTVDTWIAWTLSGGTAHVTDLSNAAVTGLVHADGSSWNAGLLETLRIPTNVLPEIVDSTGAVAEATALDGAPSICGIAGDQQASLVGQGCVRPGSAKITFGTGGMLDVCLGAQRPAFDARGPAGTFPIVAWRSGGVATWGVEAVMLSAGTNVEWLRDDLGLIGSSAESDAVAASVDSTDGVVYVPALLGLGTPQWDYGARGTLLGLTRGTERAHVVRAVLEGVAQRGADLVEAAEADGDVELPSLRVDGGMTANATFVQALADAAARPVEVSPELEATTRGAGFLAGLAIGTWGSFDDLAATWAPRVVVEPAGRFDRDRWREACRRAGEWVPELSSLDF
jgi:glycerol kinase